MTIPKGIYSNYPSQPYWAALQVRVQARSSRVSATVFLSTLAVWLWVGNGMLRRLSRMSERMRGMAGGDLETSVSEVEGDEIGELVGALSLFTEGIPLADRWRGQTARARGLRTNGTGIEPSPLQCLQFWRCAEC